jgi:diguanylate cyclase (GGDEF)-like protein/putative nucleotidyltransferase with HDIG domain
MPGLIEFETTSTAAPLKTGSGPEPEDEGALLAGTQTIAHSRAEDARQIRVSRETARLLPIVAPVIFGGTLVTILALSALAAVEPAPATLAGMMALLLAATFVEAFPVPIENVPVGGTSLATVFIVGTAAIYGWAAAVVVGVVAQLLVEVIRRQPAVRILFNTSVYALGAAAAGAVFAGVPNEGFGWLALEVTLASTAFYAVNIPLVVAVVSRWAREGFLQLLRRATASTFAAFAIMASLTLMLAVLWERSPFLSAALVGPLAAIALYQRSVHRELAAMRLALTDPLTGLGNHRHFHERLDRDLTEAEEKGLPLSVCLLDIDNFKELNDTLGHPKGDLVLSQVAGRLRQDGEAFRIGGDEFALLLPGRDEHEAIAVADGVLTRVALLEAAPGLGVRLSAGVVTYPQLGLERSEIVTVADQALYLAKETGKSTVRAYHPDLADLPQFAGLGDALDRGARLKAAASLAHAVDARDAYTGHHSHVVAELSARIAELLGLDAEEVELVRLAGSLHDLGKLAIPSEILRKPDELNESELLILRRHPQIGYRILRSLGVEPVSTWVLHHHERWDGRGYPHGLGGEDIPLGSRILFVADAYDAMTSDRVYQEHIAHEEAIAELERCAGSQFDPQVVAVFVKSVKQPEVLALKSD